MLSDKSSIQKTKSRITYYALRIPLDYGLLTAIAIPLLALMPLLTYRGLPNTADGPVHLMRQVELNQAWAEGNFYPRWGTDLALGHGMPIFSYAPPFLYQLTQLFHLTGLPLDEAMKGVLVFDFLFYSLGMFLFTRRIYGPYPALVAAAVYVYAPYRLREAYIQGNYGQFSGLAFYPLILWAFQALMTDGRPRYLIAAAVSLAGLLFSHNISFMLFAPLFAAYLVILVLLKVYQTQQPSARPSAPEQPAKASTPFSAASDTLSTTGGLQRGITPYVLRFMLYALRPLAGLLLGLGLAAIFWLPAFGERHDIKLEGIIWGFFDFRENFISLPELFSPPYPLDLAAINPVFPLGLGLAQLVGACAGSLILIYDLRFTIYDLRFTHKGPSVPHYVLRFTHTLFFSLFLLLYIFLALPYSRPIWEAVPLVELTEFPWRMLGPAILCASILTAAAVARLLESFIMNKGQIKLVVLNSLLFIVIASNLYYLYPSQFIVWGTPTPVEAFAYEAASGAIGTTSTGEFLPRRAQQHPRPETLWPDYTAGRRPQKLDPATLPGGAEVNIVRHQAEADTFTITTPTAFTATLRTLYWPGWRLYLNDQPHPFSVADPTGLIQTVIPAGQHTLTLQLESTALRTTGLWLTLATCLVLILIASQARFNILTTAAQPGHQANPKAHYLSSIRGLWLRLTPYGLQTTAHVFPPSSFFFTTAFLLSLYLISRPLAPFFVLRSNPDRPQLADQTLQVDFADQIRLVGMDALPEIIELPAKGETELTVVLYWRALQPTQANYSVFLHLDAPNGRTFATVDEVSPEDIPTGNWPPGLYLRNPLRLKLPADLPPIRYHLTAGLYNRETGQRLAIQADRTLFQLGSVWLAAPSPPLSNQEPLASFGPHISLHQAILTADSLTLVWQTNQPIVQNYSIFVHALDAKDNLLGQADGVPYQGLYPLPDWRPGQFISDFRSLDLSQQPARVAIGIYDPTTGQRLPAFDAEGKPLPNDSFSLTTTE